MADFGSLSAKVEVLLNDKLDTEVGQLQWNLILIKLSTVVCRRLCTP